MPKISAIKAASYCFFYLFVLEISFPTALGSIARDSESNTSENDILENRPILNSKEGHLLEKFILSQRRENEQRQQGLFPKLFGYFRGVFSTSAGSSNNIKKAEKPESDLPAYEDSRELDLEDELVGELDDGVSESFDLPEKGRDFDEGVGNGTDERRGLPIYLFQGQYLAEPRLNRFVDGAMDNLGQEMKSATLDPMYFKVMPRGKVVGRQKPIRRFPGKPGRRRRRPVRRGVQRLQTYRPVFSGRSLTFDVDHETESGRQLQRRPAAGTRATNQNAAKNKIVGAGRIDGLSKVLRDGDAEMQLFGNYTLIRSHYNMGPLHLVMQFRTIRGLRRADATLERVKIHTVTRVNTQGCEMIDFLLDRPHPETIELRGQLFPMAARVAKNIFSRLFAEDSFLVARVREKTGLALLSKKTSFK